MASGNNGSGRPRRALTPDVVLRAKADLDVKSAGLRDDEVSLLEVVDGKRTVNEVMRESKRSGFVTMRLLRSLYEKGAVEPVEPEGGDDDKPRGTPSYATQDMTDVLPIIRELRHTRRGSPPPPSPVSAQASSPPADAGPAPTAASESGSSPRVTSAAGSIDGTRSLTPPPSAVAAPVVTVKVEGLTKPFLGETPPPFRFVPGTPSPVPTSPAPSDSVDAAGSAQRPISVGPFKVILRIAKGGFGSIYLARRRGPYGFERLFSLKVIRQYAAAEDEALRAFEREARVGAKLSHPNVQGVLHVGAHEGHPYLILDYVEGATLQELLVDDRPTPAALVVSVVADVLRGLHYVHELRDDAGQALQIVHGDVSTENILVGLDGAARLCDFGSAKSLASGAGPASGPAVGKPGFMTPEQLQGERVDARSDLFAMGIVLWQALTGRRLFADTTFEGTVMNVLRKSIEPPSAFGAPACLDPVVLKALARTPASRYQSADEMRLDLLKVASANGLLASGTDVSDWVRRTVGEVLADRRRRVLAESNADTTTSTGTTQETQSAREELASERARKRTPPMSGADGSRTLIMKRAPGGTLETRLRRGRDTQVIDRDAWDAPAAREPEPRERVDERDDSAFDDVDPDLSTAKRRVMLVVVALAAATIGGVLATLLRPGASAARAPAASGTPAP